MAQQRSVSVRDSRHVRASGTTAIRARKVARRRKIDAAVAEVRSKAEAAIGHTAWHALESRERARKIVEDMLARLIELTNDRLAGGDQHLA